MTNHSTQTSEVTTSIGTLLEHIRTCDTSSVQEIFQTVLVELRSRSDADCIAIVWQTDDVQMQRPDLTEEQCQEVLHRLNSGHDANIGINWDVIDCVAHDCYPEPDNLDELRELAEAD